MVEGPVLVGAENNPLFQHWTLFKWTSVCLSALVKVEKSLIDPMQKKESFCFSIMDIRSKSFRLACLADQITGE